MKTYIEVKASEELPPVPGWYHVRDQDDPYDRMKTIEYEGDEISGSGWKVKFTWLKEVEVKQVSESQKLMNEVAEWSDATFGVGQRNPAIVYHLKKEVDELIKAFDNNEDPLMEIADCFMLLLDSAHHVGITHNEILQATKEKLEINKKRKWGNPDENGVVEHIPKSGLTKE